jgi:hypothetical protein
VVEPTGGAPQFLIYGRRRGTSSGVIIHADFTGLSERVCVGADKPDTAQSDFETWRPSGAEKCLMGAERTYIRKKFEAECLNTGGFAPSTAVPCPCTRADYRWFGVLAGLFPFLLHLPF